ncbi:L-serine ammonia-lyase, iron-sulfur-dependent, subunit alpha [Schaalia naturae]|uniref:L-serine ammonia-lyase n=1 Tax=Schaalia naturae TaxID=635203 RepID=A0ABW2SPH4_9ACTO
MERSATPPGLAPTHADGDPVPAPAALVSGAVAAADAPHPLSFFDLFRIGIGPSSSHTVGPMRAARAFAAELGALSARTGRLTVDLFGSLGATGRGHSTDRAILLGLEGHAPETVGTAAVESVLPEIARTGRLALVGSPGGGIPMDVSADIRFRPSTRLPYHVNALTLTAWPSPPAGPPRPLLARTYYSVGGGFVMAQVNDDPAHPRLASLAAPDATRVMDVPAPHPFATARELVDLCTRGGLSIASLVRANEESARPRGLVDAYLDRIVDTMMTCIRSGCEAQGILPGGLDVPRRAHALAVKLTARPDSSDPMRAMDWVNLFALAVNEENASGHRVVTAPTNGAAGVVPAVLAHLLAFCPSGDEGGAVGRGLRDPDDLPGLAASRRRATRDFLLTATAVGALIKTNASIAGAEVGCQGEVGSASAMAAAGLAQVLGGTPRQVENAAEIAMEHSLGLTCDPVGGLVQIPCIERNAIAAVKAINAARMALWGDGRHMVSLDAAIETMRQTGNDMLSKYKETSAGGLAVNVVEC